MSILDKNKDIITMTEIEFINMFKNGCTMDEKNLLAIYRKIYQAGYSEGYVDGHYDGCNN